MLYPDLTRLGQVKSGCTNCLITDCILGLYNAQNFNSAYFYLVWTESTIFNNTMTSSVFFSACRRQWRSFVCSRRSCTSCSCTPRRTSGRVWWRRASTRTRWRPIRCQFQQHFTQIFSYKRALHSFSLITVWLCTFLAREYRRKSCL